VYGDAGLSKSHKVIEFLSTAGKTLMRMSGDS